MTIRSDIHDRLAQSLREARRVRGLSLDAVAKLSGVSRSMVSQIERGESSPTVATLWNLTQALQVDFAGLLEGQPRPGIEVIRAQAAPVIAGRGDGVTIRILSAPEAVGHHEVYELIFAPGAALVRRPAQPGHLALAPEQPVAKHFLADVRAVALDLLERHLVPVDGVQLHSCNCLHFVILVVEFLLAHSARPWVST